ncbi:MAG: hypothetical protein CL916_12515 [Deltaproteobacteria bacterium]|nr:hypothetical protein [Deltaproteobacteria bacterium]
MELFMPFLFYLFACRSDEGLKAYNSNPLITITSHTTGAEILEGNVEIFTAQVSDPNHDTSVLEVQWLHNQDVICDWSTVDDSGQSSCSITITIDSTEILAQVQDPEGAAGTAQINLDVFPTEAPRAQITNPLSSGIYYSDQKITFEGSVSDTEDDDEALAVSWHSDIDGDLGIAEEPSNTGAVIGYTYLSEGEHAIELRVEDSTGKSDTDSVLINVGPPNSAPTCSILEPINGTSVSQGSFVTFEGLANDVDVSPSFLFVTWSSDKDGEIGSSTPNSDGSILFAYADLSVDIHAITLTATDEVGATCTNSILLTVGTAPSINITSPTNGDVYAQGDSILFSATVADEQDSAGDISLNWELDGTPFSSQGATSTGTAQFIDSTLPAGTHTLIVTATDSSGLDADALVSFTVNGLPSTPTVILSPIPAYTDTNISALASGSVDPEGSTVTYTYQWLKNGVIHSNTSSILSSIDTLKGELWTVRVTPNDGIGDGETGEESIIISNTPPQISTVTISPNSGVFNDSMLTCAATATDPDEILTPTYEWSINGSIIANGANINLGTQSVNANTLIDCTATVEDDEGESAVGSASVTTENRQSEVTSLSLSPAIIYTNDTVTANTSFSDPDGQSVTATYEWHVIDSATGTDSVVQNNADYTLNGTLNFQKDDQVYVRVTPNDGIDDGIDDTSVTLTVSNTPPTAAQISISPSPASIHDDLVCTIDTASDDEDADSITYTYEWSDSNGIQLSTSSSSFTDTLPSSLLSEDDWICSVTPNDGDDDGTTATSSVTVEGGCSSLSFDGIDDSVLLGNTQNMLSLTNTFSVCTWAHLEDYPLSATYGIVDLEATRSSSPILNSGIAIEIGTDGRVRGHYGTGTFPNEEATYSNTILETERWYHICLTRAQADVQIYINGLLDESNTLYADDLVFDGGAYETDIYQLGLYSRNGAAHSYFHGMIREVGVWDSVLSGSEIALLRDQGVSGLFTTPVSFWSLDEGAGTVVTDLGSGGNDGSIAGPSWIDGCPSEDLDLDGVPHWQDCDDTDPSISFRDGSSSSCPAQSCSQILDDGHSQGTGTYWLKTSGNGAFQVYCDMDGDDGGWTLVASISSSNKNHWGGTNANNIASANYPIPFESTQAGRRMSDEQVKSIASDNVFRVEIAQNQAREGQSDFILRTFFRYSTPSEFSFNARGGGNAPLIWTSHSYPFLWEEDGDGDGYHFGCNDYDYAVFDSHNENCPNVWVSSEYYSNRVLYGHTPVNGLLSEPLGGGQPGYLWVR